MIRSNAQRQVLLLGLLVSLGLGLAGCGGEEEKAAPPTPAPAAATPQAAAGDAPAAPDTAGTRTTTRAQERAAAQATPGVSMRDALRVEVDVPEDYPEDAPVYPGSTASLAETFGSRTSVTFATADEADRVIQYIENDLAAKGWENIRTESMDNGSVTHGFKSSRKLSVMTARIDDGDPVTIVMVAVDQ